MWVLRTCQGHQADDQAIEGVEQKVKFRTCPNCLGELKFNEEKVNDTDPDYPLTDYDCYRCGRSWYIQPNGDWKDGTGVIYSKAAVESWQKTRPRGRGD